jgi:hypothetical protein
MIVSTRYSRTSWFFKFCECLLAAIAILNILMMPLELLPQSFWRTFSQYFEYSLSGTFIVALVPASFIRSSGSDASVWERIKHTPLPVNGFPFFAS